jgi:hypothetical protein
LAIDVGFPPEIRPINKHACQSRADEDGKKKEVFNFSFIAARQVITDDTARGEIEKDVRLQSYFEVIPEMAYVKRVLFPSVVKDVFGRNRFVVCRVVARHNPFVHYCFVAHGQSHFERR